MFVWCPCKDDSRLTSRHHMAAVKEIIDATIRIKINDMRLECRFWINILAADSKTMDATIGHGLGDTIWNGCDNFVISEFH